MIAHTDWTHTWTTMLLGSEHGYHGASPRVPRREGLGPTESHASHRTRFGSHVKKSWDPPGPTEPDLGPVEKSSDSLGPTKYVSGHVQGWWF